MYLPLISLNKNAKTKAKQNLLLLTIIKNISRSSQEKFRMLPRGKLALFIPTRNKRKLKRNLFYAIPLFLIANIESISC